MLEETYSLTKENNSMLRSIRRGQFFSSVFKVIYWAVIIFASYGAYKYAEPYIQKFSQIYQDSNSAITQLKSFGDKMPK